MQTLAVAAAAQRQGVAPGAAASRSEEKRRTTGDPHAKSPHNKWDSRVKLCRDLSGREILSKSLTETLEIPNSWHADWPF